MMSVSRCIARNHVATELSDEPAANSGDRLADGNTCVHERENTCAHAGHRGRAVRFHDLAAHANGIGELTDIGNDRRDAPLGERSMADLPSARAARAPGFSDAERREIIVEDKALAGFSAGIAVELLSFVGGRQRRQTDGLRFAALEEGAAMTSGKQACLRAQGTDLLVAASIAPDLLVENTDAKRLLLQIIEKPG